jgi:excinuclease ABC subunit C
MSRDILPEALRAKLKNLPDSPGVYIMRGPGGGIIYVGKAVSLKKRVRSYFRKKRGLDPKTRILVSAIADVEYVRVKSEEEALLLEAKLIREIQPKYNISLKDDKRYPMVRVSSADEFPRISVVRFAKTDGAEYFGPYTDAGGLRKVLRLTQNIFKLRGCRYPALSPSYAKHCMYCKINACLKPCLGLVSRGEYRKAVDEVVAILKGYGTRIVGDLKREMKRLSILQEYEKAAALRDSIAALESILGPHARTVSMYRRIAPGLKKGLEELRRLLAMTRAPQTIEAVDISNISGLMAVGSVVVFKNGVPSKDDYRRFRIKDVQGVDDYEMVREVVRRRYGRLMQEKKRLPDLILIDGGKGHLSAALREAEEIGLAGATVASIAKQREEVFVPGSDAPVQVDTNSPAMYLLQHIRDEAHRFAISYHRSLRDRRIRESVLDDIPGVGLERKRALLSHFGSIDRIRRKTLEEIAAAPGINMKLAQEIYDYLHN